MPTADPKLATTTRAGGVKVLTATKTATPATAAPAGMANQWAPKPDKAAPLAPGTLEETGLTEAFVADLTLKVL